MIVQYSMLVFHEVASPRGKTQTQVDASPYVATKQGDVKLWSCCYVVKKSGGDVSQTCITWPNSYSSGTSGATKKMKMTSLGTASNMNLVTNEYPRFK